MKKRFKGKKERKKLLIKLLVFIILVLTSVLISFNFLYQFLTKNLTETQIMHILLNDEKPELKNLFKENGIQFLVNYTLGLDLKEEKQDENLKEKEEQANTTNTIKIETEKYDTPLIYIYNTHQTEEYRSINTHSYNINPTVLHASLIFQKKLSDVGIASLVEETNIKEILNINGWNYNSSYKASKLLAQDALSKNPSISYVIDLHRDSIPESIGKVNINGKDYAKIMLVLGKEHDGYERNLEMATRINNYLKEFDEKITRGINIKQNSGIYNQDLSNNAVLIEIGGPYNDITTVSNSLEVLANVYKKIVEEDYEKEET